MAKLMALRQRYLAEEVETSPGYRVMPGVVELLERLTGEGRLVGLITGNTEPAAHTKLARADLNRFFAFGGYGSDANRARRRLPQGARPGARSRPAASLDRGARSRSATRRSTSRPATAPGSGSSASPPASTGSSELREAGADWVVADLTEPELPF